jgi:hypothetical protein
MLMGGNAVVKRSALETVGLYNTSLGRTDKGLLSCEDEDMFHRLLANGFNGMYVPDFFIYHYVPRERMTLFRAGRCATPLPVCSALSRADWDWKLLLMPSRASCAFGIWQATSTADSFEKSKGVVGLSAANPLVKPQRLCHPAWQPSDPQTPQLPDCA